MKSVITDIDDQVPPDNGLKCSMHDGNSPNCTGQVVAIVTFDDAGASDNHWKVCWWWWENNPDARAFREGR
ncbi:hypothetical protein ACWC24_21200 [Streptomyces sp. NPDC001443]